MNRRYFLRLGAAGLAGVGLAGCAALPDVASDATATPSPAVPTPQPTPVTPAPYPTAEPSTQVEPGTTLRNQDTAGFFVRYYRAFPAPDRDQWRLIIEGMVDAPMMLSLAQIRDTLPYHEYNKRMACVEGWSSRATWGGFIYVDLAALVKPQSAAAHIHFECADDYWESLPIAELQREGALFATHMNGAYLPATHGAPLRMIIPWLYGYKGAKIVTRLIFTDHSEKGFWPTMGPFTASGAIEAGRDFPLDLHSDVRSIRGGEITEY